MCPERIVTARLAIAQCRADDVPALYSIASDPRVGQSYYVGMPVGLQPLSAQRNPNGTAGGALDLCVRRADGEIIGSIRFDGGQLSYFVAPAEWGKGYGREMVDAACRHYAARLVPPVIHAEVIRENIASRRILERLGFRFTGLALRRWGGRQGWATMVCYELSTPAAAGMRGVAAVLQFEQ
jgi:ribosomal-protein-alanine N-acetyltransferase